MASPINSLMNTIIGPGTAFSGDLETEGVVRVDGFIRGSIKTNGKVVISEDARVEASIRARSVVVGGRIKGNVYAIDRIDLLPGSVIVGDIFASRVAMDEESTLHGDCRISGNLKNPEADLESFMAAHGGFPPSPRSFMGGPRAQEGHTWDR